MILHEFHRFAVIMNSSIRRVGRQFLNADNRNQRHVFQSIGNGVISACCKHGP
jgi:hypothetical protein